MASALIQKTLTLEITYLASLPENRVLSYCYYKKNKNIVPHCSTCYNVVVISRRMMDREFILTEQFEKQLKVFANSDELLLDIEQEIFKDLELPISSRDMIQGTGSFTKVRVPLKAHNVGKRGAIRVIYLDCPVPERVFLMMVYSKSSLGNISDRAKQALKLIGQELKSWQPKKK